MMNNKTKDYSPEVTGELVKHKGYSLSYNEEHEQADWVYYTIHSGETKRVDHFRSDRSVDTDSASREDYRNSGYDKGHLCPAAAMKDSRESMNDTFYMSNISPQESKFNQGVWRDLETHVREMGQDIETHVVTGPVFKDNKGTIGKNEVTIPGYYYKVLYQPETNNMEAYLLPNEGTDKDYSEFKLSTDELEDITGIDFFSQLPDDLENQLEKE